MLELFDEPILGQDFHFYLVFDFIKVPTLEYAIYERERLLNHNFDIWKDEDNEIYHIISKYDEVRKDGSIVYSDIKKIKCGV